MGTLSATAVEEATKAAKQEVVQKGAVPPEMVRNANGEKVSLKLYGQVNRAYLFADDGDSSDSYFVDNDASSSRMGAIATAQVTMTYLLATKLRLSTSPTPAKWPTRRTRNLAIWPKKPGRFSA